MRINEFIIVIKDITTLITVIIALFTAAGALIEAMSKNHSPLAWIGRRINKELLDGIDRVDNVLDKVDTRLEKLEKKEIKRDLQEKRSYILDFANSLRQRRRHAVEEFDHVIELIDEYHDLCEKHEITNGVIEVQSKYIVSEYMRLSRSGSFEEKIVSGDLL